MNSCCCCFTLRAGTLFWLWLSAIGSYLSTLLSGLICFLLAIPGPSHFKFPYDILIPIHSYISFICSIVCLVTATYGINGVEKNDGRYLTLYLCYMRFSILYLALFLVVIPYISSFNIIVLLQITLSVFFAIAIKLYFYCVIKSCQDSMLTSAQLLDATNNKA